MLDVLYNMMNYINNDGIDMCQVSNLDEHLSCHLEYQDNKN